MGQHRADGVALVEFVVGVGHEHHGKFQPLGAVHRHDRDAPGPGLAACALAQTAVGRSGVHGADERRQARPACTGSPGRKAQQVLAAARAVWQCAHRGQIAGAGQQLLDQLVHRQRAGQAAVFGQGVGEQRKPLRLAVEHRAVQTACGPGAAQRHKVVRRVGEHRA